MATQSLRSFQSGDKISGTLDRLIFAVQSRPDRRGLLVGAGIVLAAWVVTYWVTTAAVS